MFFRDRENDGYPEQNETPAPLYDREPDAALRRCLDCKHCLSVQDVPTGHACTSYNACAVRGTAIPGIIDCRWWEPAPWPLPDAPPTVEQAERDKIQRHRLCGLSWPPTLPFRKGVKGITCPACGSTVGIIHSRYGFLRAYYHAGPDANRFGHLCGHAWGPAFWPSRAAAAILRFLTRHAGGPTDVDRSCPHCLGLRRCRAVSEDETHTYDVPCTLGTCYRVTHSAPLPGVFKGDRWPLFIRWALSSKPTERDDS